VHKPTGAKAAFRILMKLTPRKLEVKKEINSQKQIFEKRKDEKDSFDGLC
jgi:hypothetical protein